MYNGLVYFVTTITQEILRTERGLEGIGVMKIAIIAYRSPPTIEEAGNRKHGGMSVNLYYLLSGLKKHGIDCDFLYWDSAHNPALQSAYDSEDIDRFSRHLEEKLTANNVDVVHTCGFFAAEAFKNARQHGSTLENIPWVHSNFTTISQRLYFADHVALSDLVQYEIYQREHATNLSANHLITGSQTELSELVTVFGNLANVSVINRGVDHSLFYTGNCSRNIQILSAGRMAPIKDFPFLLQSIGALQKSHPGLLQDNSCVIIGGTEIERTALQLPQLAESLDLISIVRFMDKVSHKELAEHMRQSKVFALSSKHETFGLLLAEAQACGCPTVARNNSSCPEISHPGPGAEISSNTSPKEFADKMAFFLKMNRNEWLQHSISAHKNSLQYSWDLYVKKHISVYQQLL